MANEESLFLDDDVFIEHFLKLFIEITFLTNHEKKHGLVARHEGNIKKETSA
jgi:hypothetical protein